MPEGDGEEMVCHLRSAKAEVGDVFAKVCEFSLLALCVHKVSTAFVLAFG